MAKGDEIGLLLLGRLIGLISDFGRVNSLGRFELPSSYYYHFMGFSIFHFWEKGKFYLYNMWRKPHHFLSTQVNKASSSIRPSFILSLSWLKAKKKEYQRRIFLKVLNLVIFFIKDLSQKRMVKIKKVNIWTTQYKITNVRYLSIYCCQLEQVMQNSTSNFHLNETYKQKEKQVFWIFSLSGELNII